MKTVSAVPMAEAVDIAAASVGDISSAAPALVQDATQQVVTLIQMSTQSPDQNVDTSPVTKVVSQEKPNVITLVSVSDKEASSQSPSAVAVEELDNTTADMGTVETAITPEAQTENKSSVIQDADKAGIPSEETTVSPVEDTSDVSIERDTVLTLEFTAATSDEDVTEVLIESTHICPEEDSVVTPVEETTTATVKEQAGITQDSTVINADVTGEVTAVTPGEVLTGAAQEEVVVNLLGASEEAQEEKEEASAEEKMSHTPREVSVFALVAPAEEEAVTPAEADPVGVTAKPLAVETGEESKGKLAKDVPVGFVEQGEDAIEEAEAESAKRTALPVILEAEVIPVAGGVIETEAIPAAGCAVPSAQEAAVAQVMERVGEIVTLDIEAGGVSEQEAVESEHKADEMTSIPVETEVVEKTVSPVGVGVETEVTSEAKAVDNSATLEEKSPLAGEIILNHLEAEETFQEDKESSGADKSTGI
ncbi:enolase-phosphatase E1 [Lepisosteus oculatus]|uniref:enolase-phosphatase E1 n=1 Tax=Lepisosteus oculatus TaxID=7918 RepID=UPI0035F50E0F